MSLIASFFSSKIGQALLSYILSQIWGMANDAIKDGLAKQRWEARVKKTLDEYEKVIEEARVKAVDGLTEEEKADIRKKKTELEESLFNES